MAGGICGSCCCSARAGFSSSRYRAALGLPAAAALLPAPLRVGGITFYVNTLAVACALVVIGFEAVLCAVFTQVHGIAEGLLPEDAKVNRLVAGMEIGSHGFQHIALPTVPGTDLAAGTIASRDVLRRVSGQDVAGFCYPYGSIEPRVIQGVKDAGYDYACASWPSAHTGRHALRRVFISNNDSPSRLWAKGLWYWLALSYQGPGADRVGPAAVAMDRYQQPGLRVRLAMAAICRRLCSPSLARTFLT